MNILITASECVPFAKTGGLADVVYALSVALKKQKQNVIIVIPKYKSIKNFKFTKVIENETLIIDGVKEKFSVYSTLISNKIPVYLIENNKYFNRTGIYCDKNNKDYKDNGQRFKFFSYAVLKTSNLLKFKPNIIHLNDWHTALIAPLIIGRCPQLLTRDSDRLLTVFTIHNIAFQGIFKKHVFDSKKFKLMDYYGKVSFLRAGIAYSDIITTVSKTYAKEIQGKLGFGMQDVVKKRKKNLFGIINGLDYDIWDPATDKNIKRKYSYKSLNNKFECKKDLQRQVQFKISDVPLIGIVSRLDSGKGFDIFKKALPQILKQDIQIVILGKGDPKIEKALLNYSKKYKSKLKVYIKFDELLAHKVYAGADMFLMPSKFEPCGLSQLISFKYGTVPIVRNVGGLADTVENYNSNKKTGTGFIIKHHSKKALLESLKRAIKLYRQKLKWQQLQKSIMVQDYSWKNAAKEYIKLYKK